jgi:hypothetical protein
MRSIVDGVTGLTITERWVGRWRGIAYGIAGAAIAGAYATLGACTASAAASAAGGGILLATQLVSKGVITPEQGQALIDALQSAAAGHWVPAGALGALTLAGITVSHLRNGSRIGAILNTVLSVAATAAAANGGSTATPTSPPSAP